MYNRSKILAFVVLLCLFSGLLLNLYWDSKYVSGTPHDKDPAKIMLTSWVSDDGYGQGISEIYLHENSTGSWEPFTSPAYIKPTNSSTVNVNITDNTALRVGPTFTLNHSLHSLSNITDGLNIIRSNVSVYNSTGLMFSENNITMQSGGNQTATTYWYYAYCAFDFLIVAGELYTVTITYEVYHTL